MKLVTQLLAIGTMLLSVFMPGLVADGALAEGSFENWLIEKSANELGFSPYTIQQASVQRREFPNSGVTLYQVKFYEEATGRTYSQVMDETGAEKDLDDARRAEEAAHDARLARLVSANSVISIDAAVASLVEKPHGRLSDTLLVQLETVDACTSTTVAIWLKADHVLLPQRPDLKHRPATAEAGDAPFVPDPSDSKKALPQTEDRNEKNAIGSKQK